jgi:hypothetical protein
MPLKKQFFIGALILGIACVVVFTQTGFNTGSPQRSENASPVGEGLGSSQEQAAPLPPAADAVLPPHGSPSEIRRGVSSVRERLRKIATSGTEGDWQAFLASAAPVKEKETLLECIGESGRGEASVFLSGVLNADLQEIRRAAIRGLAATGLPSDAALLREIMVSPSLAIEETTEAALALGGTKASNATGLLVQAYARDGSEELQQCILIGLSQRPFQESESFFRQMLANPSESPSRKKEALESLGQFDSVKDVFFLPYAESPEVEVRRGAYQGLGKLAESQMGHLLLDFLQKEKEELARADIYEALYSKNCGNRVLLNQVAGNETDPLIRIIAGHAVGCSLQGLSESDPMVGVFERQWLPELMQSALHGGATEGMQAVFALRSVQSFGKPRGVLEQDAAEAEDAKVRELAQRAVNRLREKR